MPSGSCVCGNIAYEYNVEPALAGICHCTDCQKWSGGSGIAHVAIPTSEFHLTKGTPKRFTRSALAGQPHHHFFCGDCGSSLYSQPESMEGVTLVKGGTLDGGAANITVQVEFFSGNRPAYEKAIEGATQLQTMV